jgi:hypothetical protein
LAIKRLYDTQSAYAFFYEGYHLSYGRLGIVGVALEAFAYLAYDAACDGLASRVQKG